MALIDELGDGQSEDDYYEQLRRNSANAGNRGTEAPTFSSYQAPPMIWDGPNGGPYGPGRDSPDYTPSPQSGAVTNTGGGSIDDYMRQIEAESRRLGVPLTENYRADLERNASYATPNLQGAFGDIMAQLTRRAAPTSHRTVDSQSAAGNTLYGSGSGNTTNTPGGAWNGSPAPMGSQTSRTPVPGLQFDDAYTKQLEGIAQAQMGEVRNNPALDQLTAFLQQQFQQRSQTPGFTPEELAVLRTQAFEPVEDYRNASKKRSLDRTAARGMLPSSGVAELDLRDIDMAADRTRTQLDRDLSINNIDRRRGDLKEAQTLAQTLGLTIPQGQRSEELNLAQLLYQLPRNALNDALAVINGSSNPNDAFNQSLQLQQQRAQEQQLNDQRNAEFWKQIADLFGGLFD